MERGVKNQENATNDSAHSEGSDAAYQNKATQHNIGKSSTYTMVDKMA